MGPTFERALFVSGLRFMRKIDPVLYEKLATLVNAMGCELVGYEMLPQGRQMTFRVYIDSPNGVTIDDCSKVSRQMGAMLDVEELIQGSYTLEVSSPGLDRPLFELEHFRKYVGKQIKIRLSLPIEGRRQYKGVLQRVEGEDIYIIVDEQEIKLPFSMVEKANLVEDIRL